MTDHQKQEERRKKLAHAFVCEIPEGIVLHNGGMPCDMAIGPCSCGAGHNLAEYTERLERLVLRFARAR